MAVDEVISDTLVVKMFYALLKKNKSKNQSIENIVIILEEILNEKVTFTISNAKLDFGHDVIEKSEDLVLGFNTTLQSNEKIFLKKYNFIVGPLKKSADIESFFENQSMKIFLTTFFNLFLPLHIQFSFDLKLNSDDEQFKIDDSVYRSRLGISTVL